MGPVLQTYRFSSVSSALDSSGGPPLSFPPSPPLPFTTPLFLHLLRVTALCFHPLRNRPGAICLVSYFPQPSQWLLSSSPSHLRGQVSSSLGLRTQCVCNPLTALLPLCKKSHLLPHLHAPIPPLIPSVPLFFLGEHLITQTSLKLTMQLRLTLNS